MNKEELNELYLNNYKRKSFQWELWEECHNKCDFCYLGDLKTSTSDERKMNSLKACLKAIKKLDFSEYNNISLIGGEFFQGELNNKKVRDAFFEIINEIVKLYVNNRIGSVWISATLTLGDQRDLYNVIDLFEKAKAFPNKDYPTSGLWICTSWDSIGRFHNENSRKNWEYHMKNIHEKYPWVKFNTTMILQNNLLELYLSDKFNFRDFSSKFNTSLFFKNCCPVGTELAFEELRKVKGDQFKFRKIMKEKLNSQLGYQFFPSRNTFISFIRKVLENEPIYLNKMFNIDFRADELHKNYNFKKKDITSLRIKRNFLTKEYDSFGEIFQDKRLGLTFKETQPLNKCGHSIDYAIYSDCDCCAQCDKENLEEAYD